jgi:hypothetical protein
MRKTLAIVCAVACAFGACGCVPIFWAAAGGVGVFAASKDTLQGEFDISYDRLWDSSLTVMKYRGTVTNQAVEQGSIEGLDGKTKVWIKLERVTPATTRLRVSARRYKMPNLEVAQQVYTKIIEQVKPVQQ